MHHRNYVHQHWFGSMLPRVTRRFAKNTAYKGCRNEQIPFDTVLGLSMIVSDFPLQIPAIEIATTTAFRSDDRDRTETGMITATASSQA